MIRWLKDLFDPGVFGGKRRSPQWGKVRQGHLLRHPRCEVCGGKKKVQVHHLQPFHLYPELELDRSNLITLCTRKKYGINCHLLVGHGGSYRQINNMCEEDAKYINHMLK